MSKGVIVAKDLQSAALDAIRETLRGNNTLGDVLSNPIVSSHGKENELSDRQRGLVASVVAVMQDKVLNEVKTQNQLLHEQLIEQRRLTSDIVKGMASSFVQGLKGAWNTPFVTVAAGGAKGGGTGAEAEIVTGWKRYLTWGNVAAAFAVLFLAVALYFTKAYSSYKDRADNQEKYIKELKDVVAVQQTSLTDLSSKNGGLSAEVNVIKEEAAVSKAKADTAQQRIEQLQLQLGGAQGTEDLQQQLSEINAKYADAASKVAAGDQKVIAARNDANTYKNLWKDEKEQREKFEKAASVLNTENNKLKLEIEKLKNRP